MSHLRPRSLLFTVALTVWIPSAARAQEDLFTYAPQVGENALTGITVTVNTSALASDPALLRVELAAGAVQVAVRDGADLRSETDLAWRGRLQGVEGSRVVLTLRGDLIVGRFDDGERITTLTPSAHGHQLRVVVEAALPPEGEPIRPKILLNSALPTAASVDPVDGIDVMVLYSPQARAGAGGTSQIEAVAQAAVDNANAAFIDSDMDARFVLVHTEETSRNEVGGDLLTDLVWVRTDSGVATLRNAHKADMVGLLVNSGDFCGRGYVMDNPGPGFEDWAFQVTLRGCAVGNLTYAHENGHNMGFEHDPANGDSPAGASYPWSFGHFVNGSFRTVMSYSNQCVGGCSRVAHFSNPDVNQNGSPTGIANQRDNARSGDLTAPIITDFRLRESSAPDLVVTNPGVSNATANVGESFTTSATVENQGNASAEATTLRYYRSTNSTISTFDTQLSTDPMGSLPAGATAPESDVHSIASEGTWWLGACVDSVANESNTGNNCSVGVQIEVINAACTGADELFLESATVNEAITWQACTGIFAGPAWRVGSTGSVTLRAGSSVVLRNGAAIEAGGRLKVQIGEPE